MKHIVQEIGIKTEKGCLERVKIKEKCMIASLEMIKLLLDRQRERGGEKSETFFSEID